MEPYLSQVEEIRKLTDSIIDKSLAFADKDHTSPYFGDLLHVIEELKELDNFLK